MHTLICILEPENHFKNWSITRVLYLCRRTWITLIYRLHSSKTHEIKHYEEMFSVKNIKSGPIFKNKTLLYGKKKRVINATALGCTLKEKKKNIDPFDVYIFPHENPG